MIRGYEKIEQAFVYTRLTDDYGYSCIKYSFLMIPGNYSCLCDNKST